MKLDLASPIPSIGSFDYIIVGAGSSGCVLANRLSADPGKRILLLEAGPTDWNPWIHVPLGYSKLFRTKSVNWMYETTPQPELNDRQVYQPRGKVLGGSSSINGLLYIRGQQEDYHHWRQLGNVGWGWDDVLPYFLKAEQQERGADAYHGIDGPLPVSDQRETHPLCDAYIEAAVEMGHGRNPDFNGASQEGAGYYQTNSRNGRRISAAAAYLHPIRHRRNLVVMTRAHVTRVLFEGKRAVGVEWLQHGLRQRAEARAEIILSSGAINTPQLLQLSGVGPAALLQRHGIDVVVASEGVGANLQDHLQVRCIYRCTQPITMNDMLGSWMGQLRQGLRYVFQRKGPLTVSAGYGGGFFRSGLTGDRPDIQAHYIIFSTNKMGDALHDFSGFTISSCQLRPESRGTIAIQSSDPLQPPLIDPRYLSAEADRIANVEGIKLLRKIMRAPALSHLVAEEIEPGPDIESDESILAYCRKYASTLYHPTCTARMGIDTGAVVDPRLRLIGAEGLRVVDGSIMPTLISGNTHGPIVMIAEKAADMIIEDARSRVPGKANA